jgi:hypothetical protein
MLLPHTSLLPGSWLPPFGGGAHSRVDTTALFTTDDISRWAQAESSQYDGLVAARPFDGRWDEFQSAIDEACSRWPERGLTCTAPSEASRFSAAVVELLSGAGLPDPISRQLHEDACALGRAWKALCPAVRQLSVKLELFGENVCSRWHCDNFVGRGIVSYTGVVGTEYTRKGNVDFWELQHCGNNKCIIRDPKLVESVAVGDLLLIKGTRFPLPHGTARSIKASNALVHKSPEVRFDQQGGVQNRLVLKVDVYELPAASGPARGGDKKP